MTRIDFHYVPSSGDLSGASFEKQTETAFNELGEEIDQIDALANECLGVSHSALETSNKALVQAQEADTRSQEALQEARDAQEKADNANTMSGEATLMAKQAYDTSLIADTNANDAQTKSNKAILTADTAQATAEKALNTASDAQQTSTSAFQLAGQAFNSASNGIPLWSEDANYIVPAICYGHDSKLYESLLPSGPDTLVAGSIDEYIGPQKPEEETEYWVKFDNKQFDMPIASSTQKGAVPEGGKERQIYVVTTGEKYSFVSMDTLLATPSLSGFVPKGGKEGQILGIKDGMVCWVNRYDLGDMILTGFTPNELPQWRPGCYFMNGDYFPNDTPQAVQLNAFPDGFKKRWGIVNKGSATCVPNFFYVDGRGFFMRAADGTKRLVASVQLDAQQKITGHLAGAGAGVFNLEHYGGGLFTSQLINTIAGSSTAGNGGLRLNVDTSLVVRTADENVSLNVGMTPVIYLAV